MFGLLNKNTRETTPRCRPGEGLPETTDFRLSGFTAGTRVATERGWRPAEAMTVGDRLLTFDNGAQTIVAVTRGAHFMAGDALPGFAAPVDVPAGAIGNEEPMVLLPEQTVLVESDITEAITGDPFALVPAKALVGYRGIERFRSLRPIDVITLHCEHDELVFADGGALMLASSAVPGIAPLDQLERLAAPSPYATLRGAAAEALVAAMAEEDSRSFGAANRAAA